MTQRILVIDDAAEMRAVMSRGLSAGGYEVDVAATLAEAFEMDPGGYDAVLVDVSLGSERGTDLIEALASQGHEAASRCLVITGGAVDMLPAGVARLAKPFQLDELLDAVRALPQAAGATPSGPARPARAARLVEVPRSATMAHPPAARSTPEGAGAQAERLLVIIRRLRARERRDLAEFLHDGPIQELTAASLELQLMQRPAALAPHAGSLRRQIDTAAGSLRFLVDEPWPARPAEAGDSGVSGVTEAIRRRTAWLLSAPAAVDADLGPAGPGPDEADLIADIVELMLFVTETAAPPGRARVVVRADGPLIQIDLTLTPLAGDLAAGDPVGARAALDDLAAALGADLLTEFSGRQWRVRIGAGRPAA